MIYKTYRNGMISSDTMTTLSSMVLNSPLSRHHVVLGDLVIEYGGVTRTSGSPTGTPSAQVLSFFVTLIEVPIQILLPSEH